MNISKKTNKFALKQHDEAGYTLLDTLLQLAILMLCMTLFVSLYPILYRTQAYIVPETLAWERFVTLLTEELEYCVKIEKKSSRKLNYATMHEEGNMSNYYKKSITQNKENIYVIGNGEKAGNVVMLTRVKDVIFEIGEDELYVEVKFTRTATTHSAYIPLPHLEQTTRLHADD